MQDFTNSSQIIEVDHTNYPCFTLFLVHMQSVGFFLIKGEGMRWEGEGQSEGKSKKCGALRRGLSAPFHREGNIL